MEQTWINSIETLIVLAIYFFLRYFFKKLTNKTASQFSKSLSRVTVIKKVLNFILLVFCITIILLIWGVEKSQFLLFVTSIITVLGIAFFAQWSIISNITAAIIIFFNHPAKIGDEIEILDKDYPVEGVIHDIGIFFIFIKKASGEIVTCPSNIFIQKMIIRKND